MQHSFWEDYFFRPHFMEAWVVDTIFLGSKDAEIDSFDTLHQKCGRTKTPVFETKERIFLTTILFVRFSILPMTEPSFLGHSLKTVALSNDLANASVFSFGPGCGLTICLSEIAPGHAGN